MRQYPCCCCGATRCINAHHASSRHPDRSLAMKSVLIYLWVSIPCAHSFSGCCGLPCLTRSGSQTARRGEVSSLPSSVSLVPSRRGWQRRERMRRVLMGNEEVEDFEVDMDLDTEKLEVFGTIITQVKMEGRVPASSHLIYDCSHGEWLLSQIAYDRKIRLFSSKSVKQMSTISDMLPEGSSFIFSGALIPKQVKRLVKMRGISAIVVRDVEGPVALSQALHEERDRLAAKGLSKVSESRERFLLEKGGGEGGANEQGPLGTIATGLGVFVRIEKGQQPREVIETINMINSRCDNLEVVGLWGGDLKENACLQLVEAVRAEAGLSNLRVVLDHKGPSSAKWFEGLQSKRRGPIMWTFEYAL